MARVHHGLLRPVALDLQDANCRLRRLPLQIEGFAELIVSGFGLVKVFLILLGIDTRYDLRFLDLQLALAQVVLGLLQFRFVLRFGRNFFRLLLCDLIDQLLIIRLLVDIILDLGLPVELHQHVALFHSGSGCG